jgi:N-acetylglucosaminyldiphosphoundecaprenol N-acetyl-beta-D-mannosaminyltransferase
MRQTVGILGTPIDIMDAKDVLDRLEQFIQERRFHQVATANTDFLINALSDPELRFILRNADLVMPDGMPVVWAARLVRNALPQRVTGADVVPELAGLAARKGYRVYMLGATPEVAQRARRKLEEDYPGLQIVGCQSPTICSLIEMDSEPILADIDRTRPDILLVAFGNPKQEKWINLHRDRLSHVPVCIGVGGTFDFIAGKIPRAPEWMQRGGMEWFHRLLQEPRRLWKRYIKDIFQFSHYLLKQCLAVYGGKSCGVGEVFKAEMPDRVILSVVGDFDSGMMSRFQHVANDALDAKKNLILDLQRVTTFDGAMLGTLINLNKRAAYYNRRMVLVSLSPTIQSALKRSQVHDERLIVADTLAEAFGSSKPVGMYWQVRRGEGAALVTVSGASNPIAVQNLEKACMRLLSSGRTVDLDMRGLTYSDSYLIAALYRLDSAARVNGGPPDSGRCLRIAAGPILNECLMRARMHTRLELIVSPEMPPDATEASVDLDEEFPAIEKQSVYAPGA